MALGFFTSDQDPLSYEGMQRKRRLADELSRSSSDTSNIRSWTQGAAKLAEALAGGYIGNKVDKQEGEASKRFYGQLSAALGGGGSPSAMPPGMPSPSVAPAPAGGASVPPSQAMTTADAGGLSQRIAPALEAFNQKFPGMAPTSGYRDPAKNAAVGGAKGSAHMTGDALDFSVKGLPEEQKQAVVNFWREQGATGIGYYPGSDSIHVDFKPGQPRAWGPDYSRTSLGQTPEWFQNIAQGHLGGPTQLASAGGPMAFAPQGQPMPAPQPAPGQRVAQALTAPANPQAGNPRAALLKLMEDPALSPQQRQMAFQVMQMQQSQGKVRPIDLGSSIGFADERGNIVRTIQKQQGKKFGPIGQDQFGNNQYGFIDERNGSVTPANPQAQAAGQPVTIKGPGGRDITVPEGMNPKIFRDEISKRAAGTVADAPAAVQKAQESLALIDQVIAHPGREFGTGMSGIIPGIPGTAQNDFITLVDQLGGRAFLEAFESLKGGGQITEMEGRKATEAMARLKRTQSEEGFLQALKELRAIVSGGLARAKANQGGGAPQSQAQPAPAAAADAPPAGVEPQIWKFMTPEERALWK